jgi:single-strand DNA-binding protein
MAGSVNLVCLLGNVGKNPEIRSLNSGERIANLTVATSESWKDKQTGEKTEKTEWHQVVCFNDNLVGIIEKYVHKGSKVHIQGALQTRKWQDKDGNDRWSTEIVISKFRGEITLCGEPAGDRDGGRDGGRDTRQTRDDTRSERGGGGNRENFSNDGGRQSSRGGFSDDLDDEIPFASRGVR